MSNFPLVTKSIGKFSVMAISDGDMTIDLNMLSGIESDKAEHIQRSASIAVPGNIHINCYLVRGMGRTILIDSGTGGLNQKGGRLVNNLLAAGVNPQDIDTVLLTHGHPDHIGGLIDSDGNSVFTDAKLCIHPREAAYWLDDDNLCGASERAKGNFSLARRVLDVYRQNLHLLDEDDVVPGLRAILLPGHTPGHTGYRIDSGGESLLIWGDIVHFPYIQVLHPDVTIAFDYDPGQAVKTRKMILESAAREKLLVAGMHFGEAAFAHIDAFQDGYCIEYVPATSI